MNSPSASTVTVVRNYFHICVCAAAATIQGRRLFRSELLVVWLLFEGGDYSRVASIQRNTVNTE